jgi:hypothetical protein
MAGVIMFSAKSAILSFVGTAMAAIEDTDMSKALICSIG